MENLDTSAEMSFDEFFGAFEGEDGNQTDTAEETVEDNAEENAAEATDEPESGETTEKESNNGAEEVGAEGEDGAEKPVSEQKFTIKVNKETREVGVAEMTELAQKGADYDRVKEQLETERQSKQELQTKLDEQQEAMDILNMISEQTKIPLADLLEQLHINAVKKGGQTDAEVKAQIRADKLERQLNARNAEQTLQQAAEDEQVSRMQREIQEFKQLFPGVTLNDDLAAKLGPDVKAGMSLAAAYLKQENARQAAEIERLNQEKERSEKVDAQNKKNQTKTPGSQRDAGGQRSRDAFDDFFDAFEK